MARVADHAKNLVIWFHFGLFVVKMVNAQGTNDDGQSPQFIVEPPDIVQFSNVNGSTIECRAKGNPQPSIGWVLSDGVPASSVPGLRQVMDNGQLNFPPFKPEDYRQDIHAVSYRCTAANIYGVISSRDVQIQAVIASQAYEIYVTTSYTMKGNTAVIKCHLPQFIEEYLEVVAWILDGNRPVNKTTVFSDIDVGSKYLFLSPGTLYIRSVELNDSKTTFQCQTRHKLSKEIKTSSIGRLRVSDPVGKVPSRILDQTAQIKVSVGDTAFIPCIAEGHPVPSVQWLVKDKFDGQNPVPRNDRFNYIPEGLVINGVDENDVTTYTCISGNGIGSDKKETNLFVTVPLKVTITPKVITSDVGKSATFKCHVTGFPTPTTIFWMKDGHKLTSNQQTTIIGDELTIPTLKFNHKGVYQCFATNGKTSTQEKAEIFLGDAPPELMETFKENIYQVGSSLEIQCSASGTPRPQIKWFLDGIQIKKDIWSNETNGHVVSMLKKKDLRTQDGGLYTCIAKNKAGQSQHSSRINVNGALAARSVRSISVVSGDNIYLDCPVYGYPIDRIVWMKDGYTLPTDLQQVVLQNMTLLINKVQRSSDAGLYTCTVSNNLGQTASSGINVSVLVMPKITPFQFQNGLKEGMRTQLQCVVSEGDLPSSIEWTKNGRPLVEDNRLTIRSIDHYSSILVFTSVTIQDNGNYTCVAKNDAAVSSYTATLSVNVSPKLAPFAFQEVSKMEGSYARITCLVYEGDLPITLRWFKDGQSISKSLNIKTRVIDDYSSILTIQNVTVRHSGNYTCTASNSASTARFTAELVVHVSPKWIVMPQNSTVQKEKFISIPCQADGFPKPRIQWTKVKGNDPNGQRQVLESNEEINVLSNGSLQIYKAKNDHQGFYFCSATNSVGKGLSKVIYLKVQAPVYFKTDSLEHTSKIGQSTEIQCQAFGDIPIKIIWKYKNEMIQNNKKYRLAPLETKTGENVPSVVSKLQINDVRSSDGGIYDCIGSNSFGSATMIVKVIVQEKPGPPEIIRVKNLGNRSVEIVWKPAKDGNSDIIKNILTYKRKSDSWLYKGVKIVNFNSNTTSGVISNLQPAISYEFRLAAENSIGIGTFSNVVSMTMNEEAPEGAPQQIEVDATDPNSLRISWKPPLKSLWNGAIRGYYIGYKIHGSSSQYTTKTFEVPEDYTDNLVYQLTNLNMYTKYSIVVMAYNNGGTGPRTDEIIVMTSEDVPSESPTDVRCSSLSPRSIYVVWNDLPTENINGILLGYKISYKSVDEWIVGAEQENKTQFSRITLQNLEVDTNYSIEVFGYTKVGDGIRSDAVYCKTYQDVPNAPDEIKALPSSSDSILVTWKHPKGKSGVITKYNIYYKLLKEGEQIPVEYTSLKDDNLQNAMHQSVNVHIIETQNDYYEFQKLDRNKRYAFWVKAISAIGEGPSSSIATATPTSNVIPAKSGSFNDTVIVPWKTDIFLPCRAVGIPTPKRLWRNGTRTIFANERVTIQYDGTLLIKKSGQEDSNIYTCYIENSHGKDVVRYSVDVQVPPHPPVLTVIAKSINSVRLKWESDGIPVRGYLLHYKHSDTWNVIEIPGNVEMYTLSDLICGTTYFIFLEAYNHIGISDPCDTISVTTQEGAFTMPSKEAILREGDTYITVFLDVWPNRGCPLQYFTVQYKSQTESEFKQLPKKYPASEKQFILSGLDAATWYILRLTAHTEGEPNIAEYAFATTTKSGGTIPPNVVQKEEKIVMFYLDPWIFIPIVVLIITIIIASVIVWLFIKRRKSRRTSSSENPPPQWSEFGTLERNRPDLGVSVDSFVHMQRTPAATLGRHIYGTLKRPREDPNPYATVHIPVYPPNHEMNLLMSAIPPPIPPGPEVSTLDRNQGWRYFESEFDAPEVPKNTHSWDQGYASADGENIYATTSRRGLIPNIHSNNTLQMTRPTFPASETTFVFPNSLPDNNCDLGQDFSALDRNYQDNSS